VNRTRAWFVVSPVVAAGVVVSHALAYRITGTPTERFHAYLEHAPQVLLVLALTATVIGGFRRRREAPAAHLFPLVAVTTFVLQEHIERLVHGGSFPILLMTPAFVVGLVLQIPTALVAWGLARWLLAAVGEPPARQVAVRARFDLLIVALVASMRASLEPPAARGRGPPPLLRPL
jgi:hypothetical protein